MDLLIVLFELKFPTAILLKQIVLFVVSDELISGIEIGQIVHLIGLPILDVNNHVLALEVQMIVMPLYVVVLKYSKCIDNNALLSVQNTDKNFFLHGCLSIIVLCNTLSCIENIIMLAGILTLHTQQYGNIFIFRQTK